MKISSIDERAFDHAWRYFELHANQRMTVFNFFLVATGLLATGIAASVQSGKGLSLIGMVLGILLSFISFIFWKLDQRVCFLMKRAEGAISMLERALPETSTHLFSNEKVHADKGSSCSNIWVRLWTYGRAFRVTFWTAGVFGLLSAAYCAFIFSSC